MNTIDLIIGLILLVAVWGGWRQGFIVQVCSLAGIVIGIWIASRYGPQVGEWLRLDEQVAVPGGFVAVLVVVVLVVAVAARLVRGLFRFAGFGIPDHLLGVGVSVFKYVLLIGALLSAFDRLNEDYTLVGPQTVEQSKLYKPTIKLADRVLPFFKWVGEQVPEKKRIDDGA